MDALPPSQSRAGTLLFARMLGPFLIITAATAIARASEMSSLLAQFEASSLWSWVGGAFILVVGLFIVAAHQSWHGATAITVSVLGWLITLRGLLLLSFPGVFVSMANGMVGALGWWIAICIVLVLIGGYLTYAGWIPVRRRTT